MPRTASAIPVGTQFSPSLIDLPAFVSAAVACEGRREELADAVWRPPVYVGGRTRSLTHRTRNLPLEAAVQYGLLERGTYRPTPLTADLASSDAEAVYERFARHVLLHCGGLRVVTACEEMRLDGRSITGDTLARYLTDQGFHVSEHNTAVNTMRMWLAKAGIFPDRSRGDLWQVDRDAKRRVLGLADEQVAALADLVEDQRAFAIALCVLDPPGECLAAEVRGQAEVLSGLRLRRASLPMDYLEPLSRMGFITYSSGGTRGGKSARLRTTPAFRADVLRPFLESAVRDLDPALSAYYRQRPEEIFRDLESGDRYAKGIALEAFSIQLMRLLGLRFLSWRKRARDTGGAEVDALLAGVFGGVPTRWQVQCKNTPRGKVEMEDVAREVGLLPLTAATHVLVVANAPVSAKARSYADEIMKRLPVTIYLLDRRDFETVRANQSALARIIRERAEVILRDPPPSSIWSA